jgi:CheY-like chemotaxis protein
LAIHDMHPDMAHNMPRDAPEDLQARISELEKADRAKDQFLALLSHELRNHIHAIRTNAWLIKARAKDPELGRPTEAIDRQVVRLSKLVDDLLDVIRVARKSELTFEDVSIQRIVSAAIAATRAAVNVERRELSVQCADEALFVQADPARLQVAIGHLLQNAVKFSPQQGRIQVRVFEERGEAVVAVRDQGVGISAEDLPNVFNLAIESARRKPGTDGLGIGLHVAKELAEAHGGSIQARSAGIGEGSEFTLRLPLLAHPPQGDTDPNLSATNGQLLRVLVVDDNHDAADSLAQLLQAYGHEAEVAYGGEQAVQRAARGDINVALVDIGMPTVDGFQVAERISKHAAGKDTLLVAITGWGEHSDRARSKQAGFAYHLTKPVDIDALASLLSTAARKKHH